MGLINLELNELPKQILNDFVNRNPKSTLFKLISSHKAVIYITKANDMHTEKLFPTQAWASMHTGKPQKEHKCYWFSDPLDQKDLIWMKLVDTGKSEGIFGSFINIQILVEKFL